MNKKSIPQIIGIIFFMVTISVTQVASGRQKNHSSDKIDNLNEKESYSIYARGTSYHSGDAESRAGKTSTTIPIKTVKDLGLACVAVDPKKIPYGSVIIGKDKYGGRFISVAVDTGSAVKSRKAAKSNALNLGFSKESPEYNALVLDFHATSDITRPWDTFTVIPYRGPDFKSEMDHSEKIEYLKAVKLQYLTRQ